MVDVSLRHKKLDEPAAAEENSARPTRRPLTIRWRRTHSIVLLAVLALLALGVVAYVILAFEATPGLPGPSDDPTAVDVVIAGEKLAIPSNMIRFPTSRHAGPAERIDLLLHWPGLQGYSDDLADVFKDSSPTAPLFFVTIAARESPLDSDARLDSVYSRFFIDAPLPGPAGLVGRRLSDDSGYRGEVVYFLPSGDGTFVARCFAEATPEMPSTCLRDVNFGGNLSMLYRFNRAYLADWAAMDRSLRKLATSFLFGD